ncbi:MAG: DUF2281 domain-containing protein [Cyanobacteriota bacterium]|nr:DUF2281 domain-containing protein [Cyanobacteriota bacterium]
MTVKELLLKEIESLPDSLLAELLNFARDLQTTKGKKLDINRENLGYSPGFFEEVAGTWEGDLVRPEQGEYEKREELL